MRHGKSRVRSPKPAADYSDLQDFENLFREHFRDFLARQLEKEIVTRKRPSRGRYWKSNPFRGMLLFDFEHAPVFRGRTKAVGEVLDALKKQASAKRPFVLVLGASGSGKSSLVRAGVLPLLTEIGTVVGDGPWRRAVTRPGPRRHLRRSLRCVSRRPACQRRVAGA